MASTIILILSYFTTFIVLMIPIVIILLRDKYNYWKFKKVKGPKPTFIFGNMVELFTKRHHLGAHFKYLYEKTKDLPFAGIYLFHRPAIIINDIDLIKDVLAANFVYFTDHGFYFNEKTQPLMNHLFNVNGTKWKRIRTKLNAAFTPNKMKLMFEGISKCGEELTEHLKSFAESGLDVDIKDTVAKFTTDVITSCAFGIDSNSFKCPDAEFRNIGKKVFEVTTKKRINMFIALFVPELYKIINGLILDKSVTNFFINMIEDTAKYREKNNIVKNDLLQFLMHLRGNENIDEFIDTVDIQYNEMLDIHLNMLEITAQAFGFFVGGFETASTSSGFLFYELAKHPEIQSKLSKEIDDVLQKHNGKVSYEVLIEMTYMEQVIQESLRLHPPIPQLFRICTKEYIIPNSNVVIEKGTPVVISTLGIQNDPNIYPDPEKFNPDRFSPNTSRSNFSFLSFGEGPRICIGKPLAMLQIRIALLSILQHYNVSIGTKKENTLEVINKSLLMTPKDMMLKLTKRIK
ncbi:putative cytochrome P450 6a14 [Arctopsyche grandis]|uniref:putative cytochrome P450 6a14 n=1 Tax=Arctopsyche grandis TaxID=121162 RepID=UPI00406D8B0E